MTLTEGLLIVVVIILTILIFRGPNRMSRSGGRKEWDCVNKNTGEITNVKMKYKSPEASALSEQNEYFTTCQDSAETNKALDCLCDDGDGKFTYAQSSYGAPGMDYKSWVTSQAVDQQVIKNHSEFVQDRLFNTGANFVGRTYAMSDWEEPPQIPYVGLLRPQAVQSCNPTQVPDVNQDWYATSQKLTWSSS